MPEFLGGPVQLALVAAILFALQAVLAKRSLRFLDPQSGAMVTIVTAGLALWAIAPFHLRAEFWRSPAVWMFAVNGLLHPTVSIYLSFEANRRMGPTISSSIAATAPLFATAGAVAALGEGLTAILLIGTLAIVAGIVALSWRRGGKSDWPIAALAFPLGAALVRAMNHVWARYSLIVLAEPLFAATLSFTVAGSVSLLAWRLRAAARPAPLSRRGVMWGMLGGVCISVAISSMYTALATGPVVVVSPVINTYPLFTLAFALLLREEMFRSRLLLGALLVVGGVVLIGLPQAGFEK